ncbi:MAG: hypothetical protein O3A59_10795 [Nitrospirae bacterium]|nr:hypothetical protein [Nitrospirota bacterium]
MTQDSGSVEAEVNKLLTETGIYTVVVTDASSGQGQTGIYILEFSKDLDPSLVFPSVLGSFSVTGTTTWTGCVNPNDDDTYLIQGTVIISDQVRDKFSGTLQLENPTLNAKQRGPVTGTVLVDGTLVGNFDTNFFINGIFDSTTQGTFTGSLINNDLTVNFSGQDIVGDTCVVNGSLAGPFSSSAFTLSVTKVGGGMVTSTPIGIQCGQDCTFGYQSTQQVVLTPVANSGFAFEGFTGDLDCLDGTVTMNNNRSCIATFTLLAGGNLPMPQELFWAKQAGGITNEGGDFSGQVDSVGNFYVGGGFVGSSVFGPGEGNETTLNSDGAADVFLAKYDMAGNLVWATRAGGVEDDRAFGTIVDSAGNLFAGGEFKGTATFGLGETNQTMLIASGTESEPWLGQFDPATGDLLWVKQFSPSTSLEGVGFDATGNLLVAGNFEGSVTFEIGGNDVTLNSTGTGDIFVVTINLNGDVLDAKRVSGVGQENSRMVFDASGNLYVFRLFVGSITLGIGEANETTLNSQGQKDIFLAKFDSNGNLIWAKHAGGQGDEGVDGIKLDSSGNIYVIGGFGLEAGAGEVITIGLGEPNPIALTSQGAGDGFVAKYDLNGNVLWAKQVGSPGFVDLESLAIDGLGNSYVFGDFGDEFGDFGVRLGSTITFGVGEPNQTILTSVGQRDIFLAKFNSNGDFEWARREGGSGNEESANVSLDTLGNSYVNGFFAGSPAFGLGEANETTLDSAGESDFFIAKFGALLQTLTITKAGAGSGTVISDDGLIDCGLVCMGDFPEHQIVTLIPTVDLGSLFAGFTGDPDCTDGNVTMDVSKTCIATFEVIPNPVLSVELAGSGSGIVTSTPVGIDCATGTLVDCNESYSTGQVVEMMAVADLGFTFVGYTGDPDCIDGTVTMNGDITCTATFDLLPAAILTIAVAGTGSGTVTSTPPGIDCATGTLVDCNESYPNGQVVSLMAATDLGSTFVGFTGDPDCVDGMVTLDGDKTCTATFDQMPVLTVALTGLGSGSVMSLDPGISCPSDCSEPLIFGTLVTLLANIDAGSFLVGWTGCLPNPGNPLECSLTVNQDETVTAEFALLPTLHTLTITKAGTGSGNVTSGDGVLINCGTQCVADFPENQVVALLTTPDAGSIFTGFNGDPDCVDSLVTMNTNKTCISIFDLVPTNSATLDVDGNGVADALTDGMLILRYMFGFKNEALVNGVLAVDAVRTTPEEILAYLDSVRDVMLDVDGNGKVDAFTDGMLIARFLMNFTGDALINGVIDPAGIRNTAPAVVAFLSGFFPDTLPPTVTITDPLDGSETMSEMITVSGNVNETMTTVTVNGVPATVTGLSFEAFGVPLTLGLNVIQVAAVDSDGNVGTSMVHITRKELDSDLDGMPDSFENLHGFNPNDPSDAGLDDDFDGITNLEEFQRGTNPREFNFLGFFLEKTDFAFTALANSVIQNDSVGISNFGNVGLDWTASADMPWVVLDTPAGEVPGSSLFDLHFTVDPSGLAPGLHHATITVNAPGVTFPPSIVAVNLTFAVLENSPRGEFFAVNIVPADEGFQAILASEPNNAEAHFFRAITRLLRIVEENQDGPNGVTFTDSLKEMLDRFGFDPLGRSLKNFTSMPPEDAEGNYILPNDSPSGADVQEFWETVVTPELVAAMTENIPMLDSTFGLTISSAELTALDITNEDPVEIDFGEVKLLEAALRTIRAASLIGRAYELNLDLDQINNANDNLQIQNEVIDADLTLLTKKTDASTKLAEGKGELDASIQCYLDASAFIRAEVDDQNNDLFMIAAEDQTREETLRTRLTEAKATLSGQGFIDQELVDLSLFFDTPFDLRGLLPTIGFDSNRSPTNFIESGTSPDPTFNGMLPNMTLDRLEQLLDVTP